MRTAIMLGCSLIAGAILAVGNVKENVYGWGFVAWFCILFIWDILDTKEKMK